MNDVLSYIFTEGTSWYRINGNNEKLNGNNGQRKGRRIEHNETRNRKSSKEIKWKLARKLHNNADVLKRRLCREKGKHS